jgi:hypothetical protein
MKVNELNGAALDWAVAKCEGVEFEIVDGSVLVPDEDGVDEPYRYSPTTSWNDAQRIIDQEDINVRYRVGVNVSATINGQFEQTVGYAERPNPVLLAAMRCYVASQLGDEVDVPNVFKGESK